MGSLRQDEILHQEQVAASYHSSVPLSKIKMSSSSSSAITALAVQLKNVASHMKEQPGNNESMDSGVAGLRDGTTTTTHNGSPASIVTHHHYHHAVLPPLIDRLGQEDGVQQYIVDRSTRTTYLKGKFLGKVFQKKNI